jgi:signal transduction histidine kinase
MMEEAEDVARLGRDVEEERRLVDQHIFEKRQVEMARVEREIAILRSDYVRAADRYDAMPQSPTEMAAWQHLRQNVAALREPVDHALELSRTDHDEKAQAEMERLLPSYQAIESSVSTLMRVDREDAQEMLARVEDIQVLSLWVMGTASMIGLLLTVLVGLWVTRTVQATQEQLARQAALLQERNRELDAFAGRVAHDLRGPLTTLKLAVGNLDRGTQPVRARQLLDRGIQRMAGLIDELLAFSRAERTDSTCDPAAAAGTLQEEMAQRLEEAGAHLTVDVEPAQVNCAEGLLRQVLWNLVDNAVKYQRRGVPAEVAIHGHPRDGEYELLVSDNGMGMSGEELRHVFEPRYRGERVGGIEGMGLGLALVKRVTEAAGGHVDVESEVGRGTIFRMHLHQASCSSSAKPATPSRERLMPSTESVPEKAP